MLKQKYACKKKYHLIDVLVSSYCVLCFALKGTMILCTVLCSEWYHFPRDCNSNTYHFIFCTIKRRTECIGVCSILWGNSELTICEKNTIIAFNSSYHLG